VTASTSLVGWCRALVPITVSGVVLLIAAGSMPALPALALVGGLGAATVLLRFGVGEQLACRALHGARSPTAAEAAVMAPAITRACAAGLGPPLVRLAVQPHGQGLVVAAVTAELGSPPQGLRSRPTIWHVSGTRGK